MKRILWAAMLMIATVQPASAKIITITLEGKFSYGYDTYNYFGAGTDLGGIDVTTVQTFDDSTPGTSFFDGPNVNGLYGFGPDYYGASTSSPGSAVVIVNGVTRPVEGTYAAELYKYQYPDHQQLISGVSDDRIYTDELGLPTQEYHGFTGVYASHPHIFESTNLDEAFVFSGNELGNSYLPYYQGQVEFRTITYVDFFGQKFPFVTDEVFGLIDLAAAKITVASGEAGAVPEPSSWVMMLAGFGLIGCALRARHQTAKPSNALLSA